MEAVVFISVVLAANAGLWLWRGWMRRLGNQVHVFNPPDDMHPPTFRWFWRRQDTKGRVLTMGRFRDVFGIGPKPKPEDEISEADARMGVTARTTLRRSDYIPGTAVKPEEQQQPPKLDSGNGLPVGMASLPEVARDLGCTVPELVAAMTANGIERVPDQELRRLGVPKVRRMHGIVRRAEIMRITGALARANRD